MVTDAPGTTTSAAPEPGDVDGDPQHLAIGEVLSLLQEEFPDVTISKIRFLESQGLIQPERTASGYRRFSAADVDRLQWILHQQRDNFLPLKVIRRMLDEGIDRYDAGGTQPTLFSSGAGDASEVSADDDPSDLDGRPVGGEHSDDRPSTGGRRSPAHPAVASAPAGPRDEPPGSGTVEDGLAPTGAAGARRDAEPGSAAPSAADATREASAGRGSGQGSGTGEPDSQDRTAADPQEHAAEPSQPPRRPRHETPADVMAALQEDPRPGHRSDPRPVRTGRATSGPSDPDTTRIEAEELCRGTGVDQDLLTELERFGLLRSNAERGGSRTYGPEAAGIVRLAARYHELGVEARHLRMYLVAAEREAGMVEQLAVPLLKQRNPRAREHAAELAAELADLGAELHRHLLRREVGHNLLP